MFESLPFLSTRFNNGKGARGFIDPPDEAHQVNLADRRSSGYPSLRAPSGVERRTAEAIPEFDKPIAVQPAALNPAEAERCKVPDFANALAHGYFAVDLAIVWQTIQNDLPILQAPITQLKA